MDGGATWSPFSTGLPIVTIFDMKLQPTNRILRIATHGRGMWERLVDAPTAATLALVGAEIVDGHPKMTWFASNATNARLTLYRQAVPGGWTTVGQLIPDGTGNVTYTDLAAEPGHSYQYRIGVSENGTEQMYGLVWVDVPAHASFALRRLSGQQPGGPLQFAVSLPVGGPATLELMDVTGRRVASMDLGGLGAGDHQVRMDTGPVKSGVYWARLSQASKMISTQIIMMR
jgi:hypothetical protein